MILISYLGTDFLMSILQLHMGLVNYDFKIFMSGIMLLYLTCLAAYTSYTYNVALAESNTDLIMNAVILLFINDLDEQIFFDFVYDSAQMD